MFIDLLVDLLVDLLAFSFAVLLWSVTPFPQATQHKERKNYNLSDQGGHEIHDPNNFLARFDPNESFACYHRVSENRHRVGDTHKRAALGCRDEMLVQNPFAQYFEKDVHHYLSYFLCKKHRGLFEEGHPRLQYYNEAIQAFISELRRVFRQDVLAEEPLLGQYLDNDFLACLDLPAAYKARFFAHLSSDEVEKEPSPRRVSAMSVTDIEALLSEMQCKNGRVYVAESDVISPKTGKPLVKIGFTQDVETASHRLGRISRKCRIEFSNHDSWPTPFAMRLEKLIHLELRERGFQHIFSCNGANCKCTAHEEYYDMPYEQAHDTAKYWVVEWMRHRPYQIQRAGEHQRGILTGEAVRLMRDESSDFLRNSIGRRWDKPSALTADDECSTLTSTSDRRRSSSASDSSGIEGSEDAVDETPSAGSLLCVPLFRQPPSIHLQWQLLRQQSASQLSQSCPVFYPTPRDPLIFVSRSYV